jgi:kallikrein
VANQECSIEILTVRKPGKMWNYFSVILLLHYVSSQNTDNCICIRYTLCEENNGTVITDGANLIDERIGPFCPSCDCSDGEVCCSIDGNQTTPVPSLRHNKCGFRNPDGTGFKIGSDGEDTAFGEFPWMIGIFENGTYKCGGSLIHPSVVLTAAHCVRKDNYTVRAGEWDSSGTSEVLKHQDRKVASVKLHEKFDYKKRNYHYDIALVFLEKPLTLDTHINLTCLPPANTVVSNVRCYATGWGKDKFAADAKTPAILKKIDLPIVSSSTCQSQLRKTRLGEYFILDKSFVCAGGEKDKDVCIGDGGGPLVCPIDGQEERYQQVGIIAWGIGCNDENVPGVYTNVPVLRDWIDREMKSKNLDTTQYQY